MKRKFIINPVSGGGVSEGEIARLKKYFEEKISSFDHVITQSKEDIVLRTREALNDGYEQIIAVGGDGTVNQVVNGFFENGESINPNALLVVGKLGTGSDFFKTVINGTKIKDWKVMVSDFSEKVVDVGFVQFSSGSSTYFINMTSAGISADIVEKKGKLPKWIPNQLKYIAPTLMSLAGYRPVPVQVQIGEETYNEDVVSLFVSKGTFAGGGMRFGANAIVDDGMFDVTLIKKMPLTRMLANLGELYSGNFGAVKGIVKTKANFVKVSSDSHFTLEVDGEFMGKEDFEITLKEKAIKVCFPKV